MQKIGIYTIDSEEFIWGKERGKFYEVHPDGTKVELTKEHMAQVVGSRWDTIRGCDIVEDDDMFKVELFIPIYDWIDLTLFGYGNTKEEAESNARKFYEELDEYNELIEKNIQRNLERQMENVHKFVIIPKDRSISSFRNLDEYYSDMEVVYFEGNNKELRDLVIELGIPSDGRADEPLTGYVDVDKIVFTRMGFIKGELEYYKNTIEKFLPEIATHYKLEKYTLYYGAKRYYEILKDGNGITKPEIANGDFDYFHPVNKGKTIGFEEER